ncbi:hypothetical protein C8R45DRAFT_245640 [Mycena sanguinolenta]|nr:hypothetical protein C8R45DRAFT_245640 [Mycena sanguinolenta]
MHTILRNSPNISDLFLTLEIYSSDNTSGLCKGLQLINPTRLILRDLSKPLKNKMTTQLLDALSQAIFNWDRLCIFDCPFNDGTVLYGTKIIQTLVKCKRLHTLVVPTPNDVSWAYVEFSDCPLKVIEIKRQVTSLERRHLERDPVSNDMKILRFIEWPAVSKFPLIAPG